MKKAKAKANEKELTTKEKRKLTDDEKEMKSLRKQIQDKAHQVCYSYSYLYVSDRLPRTVPERCYYSIRARTIS